MAISTFSKSLAAGAAGLGTSVAAASLLPSPDAVRTEPLEGGFRSARTVTESPGKQDRIEALRWEKWLGIPAGVAALGWGATMLTDVQATRYHAAGGKAAVIGTGLLAAGVSAWALERSLIR